MPRIYKSGEGNPNYKTGLALSTGKSRLYNTWCNMKSRCLNPNHHKYNRYGGRGIRICAEWLDIRGFHRWAMQSGWHEGLSIDRINPDGDYTPDNCRWVTMSDNSRRKRATKLTLAQAGEIRTRLDQGESARNLAKHYGVVEGTIWFIQHRFTHVAEGQCAKRIKEYKNDSKHSNPTTPTQF